jgi:hypothetical protein
MAQRRLELIEPDRDTQTEKIRAVLREKGDLDSIRVLDTAEREWAGTEWAGSHPMAALLRELTGQVTAAMAELGAPADRLASVWVTGTLEEDVSAQLLPFADGSGLVQVSDAILSLCGVYAQFIGMGMAGVSTRTRVGGMWQAWRAVRRGSLDHDPEFLTGLLRYYNIHQRLYGLAGKVGVRLSPAAQPLAAFVSMQAWLFVLGHEIAHHVLGHDSAPSAFLPGQHLPPCSADQQRELDADRLAYAALVRARHELGEGFGLGMVGALTAMFALHSTEQALFLRLGCTHPPAAERAAHLLDQLSQKEQQFAPVLAASLQVATDTSSAFGPGAPTFDWPAFLADPAIDSPHSAGYLGQLPILDAAQCQPPEHLVRILHDVDEEEGTDLGRAADRAFHGDAEEALLAWGVPAAAVSSLCDRTRPLTFHSLFDQLHTAIKENVSVPHKAKLAVAVSAATLVAPAISGEAHKERA